MSTVSDSPSGSISPWFAVTLAYLLPGLGQLYVGKTVRGVIIMLCVLAFAAIGSWTLFSQTGELWISLACIVAMVLVWLWNLYDAYVSSSRVMRKTPSSEIKNTRDPWLAVLLSIVVPGVGHAYMRLWIFACIFFAAFSATLTIPSISPFTSTFVAAAAAFSVYTFSPYRRETGIIYIVLVIALFLTIELFFMYVPPMMIEKVAQAEITPVAGDSMAPTLLDGDVLLVSTKKDYSPRLGDIVSIQHEEYPEIKIIKRVAALPGQTIEVKNKKIHVNGVAQDQPGYSKIQYLSWGRYGVKGRPYTVSASSFFVLGDNSLVSRDSRSIGAIHRKHFIGRAYKRIWPPSRWDVIPLIERKRGK